MLFAVSAVIPKLPADEIGGPIDADERFINGVGGRQAVDEHHRPRAFAAEVPAYRGALPEHPQIAGILGVKNALAVAQARHYRARPPGPARTHWAGPTGCLRVR